MFQSEQIFYRLAAKSLNRGFQKHPFYRIECSSMDIQNTELFNFGQVLPGAVTFMNMK
jgi:hypothetical protein